MENNQTDKVGVTVVIPVYNEEENVAYTVERVRATMDTQADSWEILLANDGSTDGTLAVVRQLSAEDTRVRVVSYAHNAGRGKALRTGFAAARGNIVVSTDADLSYAPKYILDLVNVLKDDEDIDLVIGSPYMKGGATKGVALPRLWISRVGNMILKLAFGGGVSTITGIFRAYRRPVLESLDLESDGKEIHLEILSKALALGYKVKEVPAALTGRARGKSKFRFTGTATSHLLFSFFERPMILFGVVGLILLILGFGSGIYVSVLRFQGTLNPGRPLITLVVIFILAGIQILSFGFIAIQIGVLRKEIYKVQKENKSLARQIERVIDDRHDSH